MIINNEDSVHALRQEEQKQAGRREKTEEMVHLWRREMRLRSWFIKAQKIKANISHQGWRRPLSPPPPFGRNRVHPAHTQVKVRGRLARSYETTGEVTAAR